jgi:phenylacetate-coenzyme A ligase PaaK-like adenylate-forming protein
VRVEIEPDPNYRNATATASSNGLPLRVRQALQETLSFRAEVTQVAPGTLPRFEMKAKRFVRQKVTVPGERPV